MGFLAIVGSCRSAGAGVPGVTDKGPEWPGGDRNTACLRPAVQQVVGALRVRLTSGVQGEDYLLARRSSSRPKRRSPGDACTSHRSRRVHGADASRLGLVQQDDRSAPATARGMDVPPIPVPCGSVPDRAWKGCWCRRPSSVYQQGTSVQVQVHCDGDALSRGGRERSQEQSIAVPLRAPAKPRPV